MSNPLHILTVTASGRTESVSSTLVGDLAAGLQASHAGATVKRHNIGHEALPFVDNAWIMLRGVDRATLNAEQKPTLAISDRLIDEVLAADVLVIGAPIYNFGIPASLKAWFDLVTRAGRTFRMKDGGYEGLATGKKAYVVVASAGVPVGSPVDFATPYIKFQLGFIGITDVEFISADQLLTVGAGQLEKAKADVASKAGSFAKAA